MPVLIEGTNYDDELWGTPLDDVILGYARNDEIYAGEGDDTVFGGEGWDTLHGGGGNDYLNGGDISKVMTVTTGCTDMARETCSMVTMATIGFGRGTAGRMPITCLPVTATESETRQTIDSNKG